MDIVFLIKILIGLVVIFVLMILFLLYASKKKSVIAKQNKSEPEEKQEAYPSLASLDAIIRDKKSSSEELLEASDFIVKYYGTIHEKSGVHPHPDFYIFGEILFRLCRHPQTNKQIILGFEDVLTKKNPAYTKEINDFLIKGLNSRGF